MKAARMWIPFGGGNLRGQLVPERGLAPVACEKRARCQRGRRTPRRRSSIDRIEPTRGGRNRWISTSPFRPCSASTRSGIVGDFGLPLRTLRVRNRLRSTRSSSRRHAARADVGIRHVECHHVEADRRDATQGGVDLARDNLLVEPSGTARHGGEDTPQRNPRSSRRKRGIAPLLGSSRPGPLVETRERLRRTPALPRRTAPPASAEGFLRHLDVWDAALVVAGAVVGVSIAVERPSPRRSGPR